jgi:integrase
MRLTDISIKALQPPQVGAKTFFDDSVPGFGVRVSMGGTKSYVLVHGRSRTRTPIGRVGILSLKDAREKARDILAQVQLGKFQKSTIKVDEALDLYICNHVEKLKKSGAYEIKRLLNKHFRPKHRHDKLGDIQRASIAAITSGLADKPGLARHVHTAITGFFRWATDQYLEQNPVLGLKPPAKAKKRSRVLSDEELCAVYLHAADQAGNYGKLVRLLILTGQRIKQIAHLRGEYIDRKHQLIEWPPELMKSNRRHVIPYGDAAAKIIDTLPEIGFVFPARGKHGKPINGFSKLKRDFDEGSGVSGYTHHDFRRTMRTGLASLRIPREHAERLLDHRSAAMSDVEAIYDRFQYIEEMREAIKAWEKTVMVLIAGVRHAA